MIYRREPVNEKPSDIGPVNCFVHRVPDDSFADLVPRRRHTNRFRDHFLTVLDEQAQYTLASRPPSTRISVPVIYALSSEARNTAALAISSGEAMRPNG